MKRLRINFLVGTTALAGLVFSWPRGYFFASYLPKEMEKTWASGG